MTSSADDGGERRLTARGLATRKRILTAAADLMFSNGVAATTLDDVRLASGVSKSQLYRHFADKDALVHAVVELRGEEVLAANAVRLARLDSLRGLELWRDAVLQKVAMRNGAYGCELGSLAGELADVDEDAREQLAALFRLWEQLLADGFERMKDNATLRPEADAAQLATAVIAALQGGYLLAQTARDAAPMEAALTMALQYVRTFAAGPATTKPR